MIEKAPSPVGRDEEEGMVPFPRRKLVLVTESTGLEKVHIRLSEAARQLMNTFADRYPRITWIKDTADDPSHRYPATIEDRQAAFRIGNLFVDLVPLVSDPEGIAQYLLMVAAAIVLSGGQLTDEQLVAAFDSNNNQLEADEKSIWAQETLDIEPQRQAVYTEAAKSASLILTLILKTELPETHPFPETVEQKELAADLRFLFQALMGEVVYHDARNFLLASAARLLQIGAISNKALEKIDQTYSDTLYAARNARMHGGDETTQDDNDDEDDENILPWGNIV